jgi:hypothetical protein
LIEQPQSVTATRAIGADRPGPKRKTPEKRWGTGKAIDAEHSRAYAVLVARRAAKCTSPYSAISFAISGARRGKCSAQKK